MAESVRSRDWSQTPLGPLDEWPELLRSSVALVLETGFPCVLFWGRELTAIHNDAYRALLGKRTNMLGRTLPEIWPETMDVLRPVLERTFAGEASSFRKTEFILTRHGFPEKAWFDWSFSPVRELNGEVVGMINIAIETTEEVLAARRQSFRLALSETLHWSGDARETSASVARLLADFLGVDRVAYAEVAPDNSDVLIDGEWHLENLAALGRHHRMSDFGADVVKSLQAGKIFRIDDLSALAKSGGEELNPFFCGLKNGAAVNQPILSGRRLGAILFVHNASPRRWKEEELELIRETAHRIWAAAERRRTEHALARSEEHFRNLADAMPQLVWTANHDGSVDYYNSRIQAFSGFQMNGQGMWDWTSVLHPEDRDPTRAAWRAACASGETYQIEHRVRMFDGSYRWYLSRAIPYRRGGEVVKWYGTATDIDEMKKSAELLHHTEAQLSAIIARAPVGMYLVDADLRLREINPRALPVFAGIDEPFGSYIGDVLLALWPKDVAEKVTACFRNTLRTGESYVDPLFSAQLRDGELAYYQWEIHRVTLPEGQYGVVCYFIDVSGHVLAQQNIQESEARFRTMADGLPLIVWVHDAEGKQEFVNETFCEFFGVTREQMKVDQWRLLIHPDDGEAYSREFLRCVQNREPFNAEVRVRDARGEWRRIESWGRPRFSSSGTYLGMVGASADITERAQTEAAIRQSEQELRKLSETLENRVTDRTVELQEKTNRLRILANELASTEHRERKRLAALLHDDLQQLLVAAKMQMGVVARHVESEDGQRAVGQADRWIGEATEAARDLTRQLRPPILYEGGLIPAVHWLGSEMKERHGLNIEIDDGRSIPSLSDDIKALLFECIRELLFNVAKYARVKRAAVKVAQDQGNLLVTVSDEGRGFDVLSVARDHRKEGFGLFSIRERIAALGGKLTIESFPGRGTRIELSVPIAGEEFILAPEGEASVFRSARPLHKKRSAISTDVRTRVLIVDDHTMVREGIANTIDGDDRLVVVGEAANGIEAIEAVAKHMPDVVLMDLNMPRMNGIEATREIRRSWPAIVVVGLSVQSDDATAKSMLDAGAAQFLSKAGDTGHMIATIHALAKRAAPDEARR